LPVQAGGKAQNQFFEPVIFSRLVYEEPDQKTTGQGQKNSHGGSRAGKEGRRSPPLHIFLSAAGPAGMNNFRLAGRGLQKFDKIVTVF
jgi:hypothetical protein